MRFRSLAVAAAVTVALLGGIATPGHASPAPDKTSAPSIMSSDSPQKTLLAYGPGGSALYADAAIPGVTPVRLTNLPGSGTLVHAMGGDCGIATCSFYFTRSQTKHIHDNIALAGGGIAALASTCGLIGSIAGPPVGFVCAAGAAVYGSFFINAINRAAGNNQCLRVRWLVVGGGYTFYSDGSKYCKN
jgi:hypothetical protein